MEVALKNEIKEACAKYMQVKGISQDGLADLAEVNLSYVNSIVNGKWEVRSANARDDSKGTPISDQWFMRLGKVVGVEVEKEYWPYVETRQMKHLLFWLGEAKKTGRTMTLLCETGRGKTLAVERFKNEHPKHTYVITVNSLMRMHDVVNMICELIGVPLKFTYAVRLQNIALRMREIAKNGSKPILIIDEGENMEHILIKMLKGLYDYLTRKGGVTSIVLLGTAQLDRKVERLKNNDSVGGPQFYRRFKAGRRVIDERVDFEPFYNALGITDKGLRKLLGQQCDNYGELHDYLEPALRMADERGEVMDEEFFRHMYNMPR